MLENVIYIFWQTYPPRAKDSCGRSKTHGPFCLTGRRLLNASQTQNVYCLWFVPIKAVAAILVV